MALANRYRAGEGLIVLWVTAAGTLNLTDDYTALKVKRSIDLIDVTAGNENDKSYIAGIKDGDAQLDYYAQSTGGTLIENNLVEGTQGTLIYSPRGTTAGKPKRGWLALVKEFGEDLNYDEAAADSVTFQKSGPVLYGPTATW